ncbi:MAG: hypothetical protein K8R52_10495, partial [Bacteroidales bacterium]|nr:hypothetical protein [Bacteroidales bacterium]
QPVPNVEENIPYLMTFGEDAETSWGDDDFTQAFFSRSRMILTSPFLSVYLTPIRGVKLMRLLVSLIPAVYSRSLEEKATGLSLPPKRPVP